MPQTVNEMKLMDGIKKSLALLVAAGTGYAVGRFYKRQSKGQASGPRYLIVNADDFGMSDGVTEGVIQAWRYGVVTSTSALINLPGAPERIARAHARYPKLPIGLHLNVTLGKPVLPPAQVPSLVDETGHFYDRFRIFEYIYQISLEELRAELVAQAEALLSTGVSFDHIDYHQHLMVTHTPFYPLVCDMARHYGVPVRQPVPESFYGQIKVRGKRSGATMQTALKFVTRYPASLVRMVPSIVPATYHHKAWLLDNAGIRTTNWLVMSLYDKPSADNFISVLRQLPPGISEIVVHPAVMDDGLRALGGSYVRQRVQELTMLTHPRVRQALDESRVELVDFSFVKAMGIPATD